MYSEFMRLFIFIFGDIYRVKSFLLWNAQKLPVATKRPEPVFPEHQAGFVRSIIENSVDTKRSTKIKINKRINSLYMKLTD